MLILSIAAGIILAAVILAGLDGYCREQQWLDACERQDRFDRLRFGFDQPGEETTGEQVPGPLPYHTGPRPTSTDPTRLTSPNLTRHHPALDGPERT